MMILEQFYSRAATLIVVIMLGVTLSRLSTAEEPSQSDPGQKVIKVGNVAVVTPEWQASLSQQQRAFYDSLISSPNLEWNDGVPFNRLIGLYDSNKFDCMVAETSGPKQGTIFSSHSIRFEMVIFGRRGENLFDRNVVTIGYLATLPHFEMPFVQPIEWYGLRTISQGVDLIKIGRIDVLVAHDGMFQGDPVIAPMPFPPVHVVELTLRCHDTPFTRAFIASFDMRVRQKYENSTSRIFKNRILTEANVS